MSHSGAHRQAVVSVAPRSHQHRATNPFSRLSRMHIQQCSWVHGLLHRACYTATRPVARRRKCFQQALAGQDMTPSQAAHHHQQGLPTNESELHASFTLVPKMLSAQALHQRPASIAGHDMPVSPWCRKCFQPLASSGFGRASRSQAAHLPGPIKKAYPLELHASPFTRAGAENAFSRQPSKHRLPSYKEYKEHHQLEHPPAGLK